MGKILNYLDSTVSDLDQNQNKRKVAEFILSTKKVINTDRPKSDCIERLINICKGRLKEIGDLAMPHERIKVAKKFIGANGDKGCAGLIRNSSSHIKYQGMQRRRPLRRFVVGSQQKNRFSSSPVASRTLQSIKSSKTGFRRIPRNQIIYCLVS